MTITSNFATPSYLPTRSERNKVVSTIKNSTTDDVFIILFRKKDGELTQRVASRLHFSSGNNVTFWSSMEDNTGAYRCASLEGVFSLTKVSKNQVEKLEFAGRL